MRLIDADALYAILKQRDKQLTGLFGDLGGAASGAAKLVLVQPTVDAVPVAHSEWIPKEKADTPYGLEMECAKCGFSVIVNDALYFKFCPHCGAKMDEGDGNDGTAEKTEKTV